jgi:hypothetical protein
MPGSMRRREESGANGLSAPRLLAPPADPTAIIAGEMTALQWEAAVSARDTFFLAVATTAWAPRGLAQAKPLPAAQGSPNTRMP